MLYGTNVFTDSLFQINPVNGNIAEVTTGEFVFVDDIEANVDGTILVAASFNGVEGVFSVDPTTGDVISIINENDIDSPFWAVQDIAVVGPLNSVFIPEPTIFPVLAFGCLALLRRRRCQRNEK